MSQIGDRWRLSSAFVNLALSLTNKFKRSLKIAKKRGLNRRLLEEIVDKLQSGMELERRRGINVDSSGYRDSFRFV